MPRSKKDAAGEHHPWMLCCLIPLGFGTWVPMVAGLRARHVVWTVIGALLCLIAIAGLVTSSLIPDDQDRSIAGMLIVLPWAAAAAMTLAIYPAYRRRRPLVEAEIVRETRSLGARRRREHEHAAKERERARARELARKDPLAALERGVGRPDEPGSEHGNLVDVNHAPDGILQTLPGIDPDLSRRIVATRENVGRFSSVADMGFVLDLDPDTIARLQRVAIAIDA